MKKKETKLMRQIKIYDDDARFIEYLIAVEGIKETFASVIADALEDKYPEKRGEFAKVAGIAKAEKGKPKQ